MAEVLLFHHAQGRTAGVAALADEIAGAGHTVHVPDLYDGRTFDNLPSGLAYGEEIGFDAVRSRGAAAAADLPAGLVYVGLSLGVMPAQELAQGRAGAAGAVLVNSCVPAEYFGAWPPGVALQVHGADADDIFVGEGDLDAARALVAQVDGAELFLYPSDEHMFFDRSLPGYDEAATGRLTERLLGFLDALGKPDAS